MKKYLIKAYFKAGILVSFYTACFSSLFFCWSPDFYKVLELALLSGLTGLCSLTIFLNCDRAIADNYFHSALSWSLLPVIFSVYVLAKKVDWVVFFRQQKRRCFYFHSLPCYFLSSLYRMFSSFQSFRATVLLNKDDEEIMNDETDA